ncbi:MAG TPA: HD domain-containing phosphohydrolase [Desulfohalobiaceae bacterium]|nr:HD domain-containing phosphohydrolase [Desulfohalobiaceae bacterium]
MQILIAEDDQISRQTLSQMLQKKGYMVLETCDGLQAWQKLQGKDSPRLLILDIMMPKIDGLELCRKIRSNNFDNPPYIILLTAKTQKEDIVQGLETGANDYIVKPYDFAELQARINAGERMLQMQSNLCSEINERKLTEEKLQTSQRLLKETQKISKLGGWEYDVQKQKTTWTDEVYRIYGVNKETYDQNDLQKNIDFYSQEDSYKITKAFKNAVYKAEPYDLELRLVSAQGEPVWVRTMGNPVFENGQIKKVVGNIMDITLRKEAEEKLRQNEEKYKKLINTSPDGIALVDESGCFLTVNPTMAHRFGMNPEELEGQTHHDLMPQQLANSRVEKIKETIEKDKLTFFEDERKGRYYQNYFVPISTSTKQNTCQIISRDISDIKQSQNELEHTLSKFNQAIHGTFQTLSLALEQRDAYTAGHQRKVTYLASSIAKEMDLQEERIQGLYFAGMVHDIGKISVPAGILAKPTKLSDIEFGLIKQHAQASYDILKNIDFPWPIAEIVLQHHERLDGSGYPNGISGEDILLESRILAVADVVEAMTSHRPYRPGLGIEAALKQIEKNKGILYDSQVVEICLRLFREKGFSFEC